MILGSSVVYALDNSGASHVRCIRVYRKPGRSSARVGDWIQVLVIRLRNRGNLRVKLGELHLALVARVSTSTLRSRTGTFFKFDRCGVILFTKKRVPLGTRLFGPCAAELRSSHQMRLLTLTTRYV